MGHFYESKNVKPIWCGGQAEARPLFLPVSSAPADEH